MARTGALYAIMCQNWCVSIATDPACLSIFIQPNATVPQELLWIATIYSQIFRAQTFFDSWHHGSATTLKTLKWLFKDFDNYWRSKSSWNMKLISSNVFTNFRPDETQKQPEEVWMTYLVIYAPPWCMPCFLCELNWDLFVFHSSLDCNSICADSWMPLFEKALTDRWPGRPIRSDQPKTSLWDLAKKFPCTITLMTLTFLGSTKNLLPKYVGSLFSLMSN